MTDTIKAEFRKLLSVRSTYGTVLITLLLIAFMAFYIEGYHGISGSAASQANEFALREIILNATGTGALFIAIISILFMVHEYRYNTIVYTLTASNSRTKVLLSKILTVTIFAIVMTLLCALFGIGCYYAGIALRGAELPGQNLDLWLILGKSVLFVVSYALIGLLFAVLTRNLAFAIGILFLVPSTVEPLLGLVLKEKAAYLPFAALERLVGADTQQAFNSDIGPARAAITVMIYLVVGWVITWYLFLRRDAN